MRGQKAELLLRERFQMQDRLFVEIVIWQLPKPLAGSAHFFKYRLAMVEESSCVVRYDNEAGKGDHKHIGESEVSYTFSDLETLQADFWNDVERRMKR